MLSEASAAAGEEFIVAVDIEARRDRGVSRVAPPALLVGDRAHFTDYAFVDAQGAVDVDRLRYLDDVLAWLGGAR